MRTQDIGSDWGRIWRNNKPLNANKQNKSNLKSMAQTEQSDLYNILSRMHSRVFFCYIQIKNNKLI